MTAIGTLILALARLLPEEERERIGLYLGESVNNPDIVPAVPDAQAGGKPDWDYVWSALLDAAAHAHRITELLETERAYFDFTDLTRLAVDLRTQINEAYGLMCEAGNLDGLVPHAGDNLDQLRTASGLRRAEIVDAELAPMRLDPSTDAPVWTVDFDQHGGFVAVTTPRNDNAAPWKFWGMAATQASAAHTLQWCFLDAPPTVVFDPPVRPQPCERTGPVSDRSQEGPSVPELLARRGSIYQQHLTAVRVAREALRSRADDIEAYLAERAAELNASDPQLLGNHKVLDTIGSAENNDHSGVANTVMWVPTELVVGTDHRVWGDFGGFRDEVPFEIATGLLSTDDLDAFTDKLFFDPIALKRSPGWAGPVYRVGGNGNHRLHAARILGFPWIAAKVEVDATAPSWSMLGLISDDPGDDKELRRPLQRRIHERAALVAGLLRRGVIDGELTDANDPTLRCQRLPAAWLLRGAQHATAVNAVYESRYPGALTQLGIPIAAGTDPAAWSHWLTTS